MWFTSYLDQVLFLLATHLGDRQPEAYQGVERISRLTLKEHRLAEVTTHVVPTHGLYSE